MKNETLSGGLWVMFKKKAEGKYQACGCVWKGGRNNKYLNAKKSSDPGQIWQEWRIYKKWLRD